jgi:hypothetical protein
MNGKWWHSAAWWGLAAVVVLWIYRHYWLHRKFLGDDWAVGRIVAPVTRMWGTPAAGGAPATPGVALALDVKGGCSCKS